MNRIGNDPKKPFYVLRQNGKSYIAAAVTNGDRAKGWRPYRWTPHIALAIGFWDLDSAQKFADKHGIGPCDVVPTNFRPKLPPADAQEAPESGGVVEAQAKRAA